MRMDIALTLPRKAVSVPLARGLVNSTLVRAGVTSEIINDVTVALTEACTNAYQHSEAGDTYELRISLDDEFFAMDVIDRGPGFDTHPADTSPVADPGAEAGRGIGLIRALTDTAEFHQAADLGGSVRMRKRVTWSEQSPWLRGQLAEERTDTVDERGSAHDPDDPTAPLA